MERRDEAEDNEFIRSRVPLQRNRNDRFGETCGREEGRDGIGEGCRVKKGIYYVDN